MCCLCRASRAHAFRPSSHCRKLACAAAQLAPLRSPQSEATYHQLQLGRATMGQDDDYEAALRVHRELNSLATRRTRQPRQQPPKPVRPVPSPLKKPSALLLQERAAAGPYHASTAIKFDVVVGLQTAPSLQAMTTTVFHRPAAAARGQRPAQTRTLRPRRAQRVRPKLEMCLRVALQS